MKLFWSYFRGKLPAFFMLLLFFCLFLGSFALYHLPLAAVLYPAGLCLGIGICWLIADFYRTKARHEILRGMLEQTAETVEELPEASDPLWQDCRALLHKLQDELRAVQSAGQKRFTDTVEYYTVWAHQIKTPIASMRLRLEQEDSELSRRLSADLGRVEQYVEMVLAFLRLESESRDLTVRRCELDGIIRKTVKRFSGEFILRRLSLHYEPTDAVVLTDEKWLSFVLEQVLSNALKYTPAGTITITVEEPLTLCVRDTGIGIAPDDLPRIFEKGYTGGNGREDRRASGLGLYLCRRACRDLGHTITAESVPGEGTVIRIGLSREAREVE